VEFPEMDENHQLVETAKEEKVEAKPNASAKTSELEQKVEKTSASSATGKYYCI